MALFIIFFAAILAACSNFFLKKNQDHEGSPRAFLVNYYLFSLVFSILLTPSIFHTPWNPNLSMIGGIAGILNVFMMGFTALALFTGPPGLTFAFQNAGAVLPAFLLYFLFGPFYDFIITPYHLIGTTVVVIGLFLGARTKQPTSDVVFQFKKWIFFAIGIFILQGVILSMFQWRCLLFLPQSPAHPLIPFNAPREQDVWFIPGFFTVALLFQVCLFVFREKRWMTKREFFYGGMGGVFNAVITFCLLLGTKMAAGSQKAVLFPFFAVSIIFFCSVWGRLLYKENVNWLAIILCIFGVFFSLL
ncbi:MAG TPA: hypothetical protein VLG76_03015 [Rhabdochlamydiaceae bacterium]|nr:hypothetical protein [Rhabdochlamydiaceae bacterium]